MERSAASVDSAVSIQESRIGTTRDVHSIPAQFDSPSFGQVPAVWVRPDEEPRHPEAGVRNSRLARQLSLDRHVALKLLHTDVLADPGILERFRHEAAALKNLSHENVVRLLDFEIGGTTPYLAFEFIEGARTLFALMHQGAMPLAEATALLDGLRTHAVLILGESFTWRVHVEPGQKLTTGGPYRVIRHPSHAR